MDRDRGALGRGGTDGIGGHGGVGRIFLLRRKLQERIGAAGIEPVFLARLWLAAGVAAAAAWMVKTRAAVSDPIVQAVAVLGVFGLLYFALAWTARPAGLFRRR